MQNEFSPDCPVKNWYTDYSPGVCTPLEPRAVAPLKVMVVQKRSQKSNTDRPKSEMELKRRANVASGCADKIPLKLSAQSLENPSSRFELQPQPLHMNE